MMDQNVQSKQNFWSKIWIQIDYKMEVLINLGEVSSKEIWKMNQQAI